MAEAKLLSSFKSQLDDQLTCSICLEQYTNPKSLPCQHSFCLECIQPLFIKAGGKYAVSCPSCRVIHPLPQGTAGELPNAFQISALLDLRRNLNTSNRFDDTTCSVHDSYLLNVYCESCSHVICSECAISKKHSTHSFHLITECFSKHHQTLLNRLEKMKTKMAIINTAVTQLETAEREVLQQGQHAQEQISTHAQQLIDNIIKSQTKLSQELDTIVEKKLQILSTQKKQAEKLHTQLSTCQQTIEHSLKEWTQQQILINKQIMMEEMISATQHVNPSAFRPLEKLDIKFIKSETIKKEIGLISSVALEDKTTKLTISPCLLAKPSIATLTFQSNDGSPYSLPPSLISSTLSSPAGNGHSAKCDITQIRQGKYNITFTPSTKHDQLCVQVGGIDIPDSPFTIPGLRSPKLRGYIAIDLKSPNSIAVCDNGDIVVAENGAHCITILDKNGLKRKSLGTSSGTGGGQFQSPRGVAVSHDGYILVTDNHRLQKLTTDGVCVKSVGNSKRGNGQLQFDTPIGIAVHPRTGQIFVADGFNKRIQVFSNELTFSHFIKYQFYPSDVAVDSKGFIYVVDHVANCIVMFSANGRFHAKFDGKGGIPGKLLEPTNITIINDLLYITEWGNYRISIFDLKGTFLHSFGKKGKDLETPLGIALDIFGNLMVADSTTGRIAVLDLYDAM